MPSTLISFHSINENKKNPKTVFLPFWPQCCNVHQAVVSFSITINSCWARLVQCFWEKSIQSLSGLYYDIYTYNNVIQNPSQNNTFMLIKTFLLTNASQIWLHPHWLLPERKQSGLSKKWRLVENMALCNLNSFARIIQIFIPQGFENSLWWLFPWYQNFVECL